MTTSNPKACTLWNGAIGSIACSVACTSGAEYQLLRGWSDWTYFVNGGDGRLGVVTFDRESLVHNLPIVLAGVFHSVDSSRRVPFPDDRQVSTTPQNTYSIDDFFLGCAEKHRDLADQALEFMLIEGFEGPQITTAIWDKDGYLTSMDSWEHALKHGVEVLECELIEKREDALAAWEESYDLPDELTELMRVLFEKRIETRFTQQMALSEDEKQILNTFAVSPKALAVTLESLKAIEIT